MYRLNEATSILSRKTGSRERGELFNERLPFLDLEVEICGRSGLVLCILMCSSFRRRRGEKLSEEPDVKDDGDFGVDGREKPGVG